MTGYSINPEVITVDEHQEYMVFIDNLINVHETRKAILKSIPVDSLLRMGYVGKTQGKLKKTTCDGLVSLAHDYYFNNADEAKKIVDFNTK